MADRHHPFDPRVSRREPFPSFDAAMASAAAAADDASDGDEESDARAGGDLDWSIDTIAELKPAAFSPLPTQKAAAEHAGGDGAGEFTPSTAAKRAQFFEDEAQYRVLQTPSPLVRLEQQQQQQQQHAPEATTLPPQPTLRRAASRPSASSNAGATTSARQVARMLAGGTAAADLHNRCQDAIAFFGDRLRERQRKLSRLQLPPPRQQTPPPPRARGSTHKRHRQGDGDFPWQTPSASERQGIHPRASSTSSERRSSRRPGVEPRTSPFSAPLTPIAQTRAGPDRSETGATAAQRQHQHQRAEPEFSFGDDSPVSPIVPSTPQSSRATALEPRRAADASCAERGLVLPPCESPPGFSDDDRDKENSRRQQRNDTSASFAGASSGAESLTLSASASWGAAVESSFSVQTLAMLQEGASATAAASRRRADKPHALVSPSVARRQEAFMAAIEAEAEASARAASSAPSVPPSTPTGATAPTF